MATRIEQLKITKFRGATDQTIINIDPKKRLVMVFGENGSGKTSVLDAIDFACNKNNTVSLENKSVRKSKYNYLPSIGATKQDLKVEIKTNIDTSSSSLGSKGVVVSEGKIPRVQILRRSSILKIITAKPAERFEEIRHMVDYPKIKEVEDALRQACKNNKKDYDESSRAYQQEEENLKKTWQDVGKKSKNFVTWAEERSKVKKDDLEAEKEILFLLVKKVNKWIEIQNEKESFSEEISILEEDLKNKKGDMKSRTGENEEAALVNLLEKAGNYIQSQTTLKECPICNNSIDRENLIKSLFERVERMREINNLNNLIDGLQKKCDGIQNNIAKINEEQKGILVEIKDIVDKNKSSLESISKYNIQLSDKSSIHSLESMQELVNEWEGKAEEKQKEYNQLEMIQRSYKNYVEKKEEATTLENKVKKLEIILEIFEEIRKHKVDNVLRSISTSVEKMYTQVHPDEGLDAVKFFLDPKKAESLEIESAFKGSTVPPQAYYSESHLDTLGVCVFLALAQKDSNESIILLDDVLTSVDQKHMNRFIDMLEKESESFAQTFIATHYRPWRDRYRLLRGKGSKIQLLELLPWNLDIGVRHTKKMFFVEELEKSMSEIEFDRQKTGSKAGILLEGLLDELTLKYGLRLPRKADHDYTLGELFDAFPSKFRKLIEIKENATTVNLKEILDELHNYLIIRNKVGCHSSELGMMFSDDEVKEFGKKTIGFAKLLICENCGAFPSKNRTGSYWECNCGGLELYPLQRP